MTNATADNAHTAAGRRTTKAVAGVAVAAVLCGGSMAASASSDTTPDTSTDTSAETAGSEAIEFDESWCGPLDEPVRLSMAASPTTTYGSHWIAMGMGYYEDENIEVESVELNVPSDAQTLLASGKLDVAYAGFNAGMFNMISSGLEISAAISMAHSRPDDPSGRIFVRKELVDSGEVTEPADIAGRRVAITSPEGSSIAYLVNLWMQEAGLTFEDVTVVDMPQQTIPEALRNGSIDAAYVNSIYVPVVEEDGVSVELGDGAWMTSGGMVGLLMSELIETDRDAARAVVRANLRAREVLQDNYLENDDVVATLAEYTGTEPEVITDGIRYAWDLDGAMSPEVIENMQEFFIGQGDVTYDEIVPGDEFIVDDLRLEAISSIENCTG